MDYSAEREIFTLTADEARVLGVDPTCIEWPEAEWLALAEMTAGAQNRIDSLDPTQQYLPGPEQRMAAASIVRDRRVIQGIWRVLVDPTDRRNAPYRKLLRPDN